jgi:F-type H+-transporting ATPase subunit b
MGLSFIGTAHAATGAADHGSAFPPFDPTYFASQLFWLAITFGLTYLMLKNVALPRIAAIIGDRKARIAADLKQAEDAQRAAEDAAKQFEANIAQAKANAQAIGQSARDAAAKEAETRRHQVESDLSAKMVAAEKAIAETKAKAMTNVEGIARDAAGAIIERLTGAAPAGIAVADALAALGRKGA